MDRRRFLLTSLAGALAAPVPGEAQSAGTPRRIGVLYASTRAVDTRSDESLIGGLRALGWIEGRNLVVERRWAEGRADRLQELAHELAQARVEVIVTAGTTAIRVAAGAASGIPIVMAGGGDPVGTGLVASLARPGGNITGVSLIGREILGKALELLKEIGRLRIGGVTIVDDLRSRIGLEVCDLPFPKIIASANAITWTRDPFDRVIVGHAAAAAGSLLTKDRSIRRRFREAVW